jgi:hypothetical protein
MATYKPMPGAMCIGELRLSSLDVGFDLRAVGTPVHLPVKFESVGLDIGDTSHLVTGPREELVEVIKAAGYNVASN